MSHQTVGYARVSTVDQNTDRQLDGIALDEVFVDEASGKDMNRPALKACVGHVRKGDTLVVHSMDRLARSLPDLRKIVDELTGKGVTVRFVKEGLTFTRDETPFSTVMLSADGVCVHCGDRLPPADLYENLLGSIAEFERSMILERQREGIAIAKAKGVYKGRKPALSAAQVGEVAARLVAGESATALAREFGVARATIYKAREVGR